MNVPKNIFNDLDDHHDNRMERLIKAKKCEYLNHSLKDVYSADGHHNGCNLYKDVVCNPSGSHLCQTVKESLKLKSKTSRI